MKKTSGTLAGGSKIVRKSIFEGPIKGGQDFAGSGKGGLRRASSGAPDTNKMVVLSETYDKRALKFRKLNNADPGPKNG